MKAENLILLLICCQSLVADINFTVDNRVGENLYKNHIGFKLSYFKVNDAIDILDIKEKELGGSSFGSIGDMDGYIFGLSYGLSDTISLFYEHNRWNIDYSDSILENIQNDIFVRFNLIKNRFAYFSALAIDVGYISNRAEPINIVSDNMLNYMIKKIRPNTDISINGGVIKIDEDSKMAIYDKNWNIIKPYLSIKDLQDDSFYTRLLLSKRFTNSILTLYLGAKQTEIKSSISVEPSDNFIMENLLENFAIPNLNRNESSLFGGFNFVYDKFETLYQINYEYREMFRDSDIDYMGSNHVVDASISKIINRNFIAYIGGKIMLRQFNGELNYLYNRYTQTQFDKKYGFATIGVVYNFNVGDYF